jgi:cytochrome c
VKQTLHALAFISLALATPAGAQPTPAGNNLDGEQAFAACAACHSLEPGEHKVGPSLHGIVGRRAAATDFSYSPALRAAELTWTRENLFAWIANCEALVPGTWMLYHNMLRGQEVLALIDYLEAGARSKRNPALP